MKKKRAKPNHRPKPKAKTKNKSPWHKFRAVPEKPAAPPEIIIPPVADADALADEIEEIEHDPDREPDELNED
jgi:hypothetical protein